MKIRVFIKDPKKIVLMENVKMLAASSQSSLTPSEMFNIINADGVAQVKLQLKKAAKRNGK